LEQFGVSEIRNARRGRLRILRGGDSQQDEEPDVNLTPVRIAFVAALAAAARFVQATTSSGTLSVSGTVESSISLTVESAGSSSGNTGTSAANSSHGSVAKFASAQISFTLTAQLGSTPAIGVAWKLNGSTLSDSAATTLTSTGTYASTGTYSWDIVVNDSAAAASVDNSIAFTATSN
jgi:hypothetical protein